MSGLWAWGVDSSSTVAGLAVINIWTGGFQTQTLRFRRRKEWDEAEKAACVFYEWRRFADAMRQHFPPATICMERPTGRHPEPMVNMAAGVTLVALNERGPVPWLIPVGSWKKQAVGHGNASKQQVIAWAIRHGAPPSISEHEADALGIAQAARLAFDKNPPSLRPIIDPCDLEAA